MDEPRQPLQEIPLSPPLPRYDGEDRRRRACADYLGTERRIPDPATEQDHPEELGASS